jgi:hypothetical protein
MKGPIKEVVSIENVNSTNDEAEARGLEEYQAYMTEHVTCALNHLFETGEIWDLVSSNVEAEICKWNLSQEWEMKYILTTYIANHANILTTCRVQYRSRRPSFYLPRT